MLADARETALAGEAGVTGWGSGARPFCAMTAWKADCATALTENPDDATRVLTSYGRLTLDDWLDREAVYAGFAPWVETVSRPWSFGNAERE